MGSQNITGEELINQLLQFVNCHLEYNKNRTHTSTEKELLARRDRFVDQHPSISLERSEEINPRTFCAHGTNAWALFSACAFSNGQLLSRNTLKLAGMVPISGESKGLSIENRNFISAVDLVSRSATLDGATKYSMASTGAFLQRNPYEYLKNKLLKKYEKRNTGGSLKNDFQTIFEHPSMQTACDRLSTIPIVVVGDGIGDSGFTFSRFSFIRIGAGRKPNEILYKRINIRAVVVSETDKEFVQKLIQAINPELEKTIVFLTTEEIEKFEDARQSQDKADRRPYVINFLNAFNEIRTIPKVAFSAMRPVRINEDVIGKIYPFSWSNDPAPPPVMRFEAGEAVYHEQCLEKTQVQAIEDICNEALQASIEVIRVVRTVDKGCLDSVDEYFREHCRFWNHELDLYQDLYGASSNNLIERIETVRSAFRIAKEEIKFADNARYIREKIREYHKQCLNKEDSSSQVTSLKIMDLLEAVIGEIVFINDRKIVHYEESIKENKALKLAGEWTFIRELIRKYKDYSQKCLNSLDSWNQDRYRNMYLSRAESLEKVVNGDLCLNGSEIRCDGEPLRRDLEELIKNIHHETSQYCNSIITLLQDLKKRNDYSIENYHIKINSISIGFEKFHGMLFGYAGVFSVFNSKFFEKHLPAHLVENVTDIKKILITTQQEIRNAKEKRVQEVAQETNSTPADVGSNKTKVPSNEYPPEERGNTLEIMSHHRNLDKEKALISEIRDYRNKLLLSKRDPNTAKNKAESLSKIINSFGEIENNLSPELIAKIRRDINQENETLRIHRHACILTPLLHVLCFFKPTILEKRVDSIKLTADLDSYLNSFF